MNRNVRRRALARRHCVVWGCALRPAAYVERRPYCAGHVSMAMSFARRRRLGAGHPEAPWLRPPPPRPGAGTLEASRWP